MPKTDEASMATVIDELESLLKQHNRRFRKLKAQMRRSRRTEWAPWIERSEFEPIEDAAKLP